jgi:prevent-host-death family protein
MSTTTKLQKKEKKPKAATSLAAIRQIGAGEFKAKCLRIMDEVKATGQPIVVTKRGEPVIKVVPITNGKGKRKKKDDFFGRLKGVIEIVGDPDDLIKPVFALDEYDIFK